MTIAAAEPLPFLPRAEVERRAAEALERHGLSTIPVSPLVLAAREGIRVNNAQFEDDHLAGMIVKRGGEVQILVNQGDPPLRKRFTIAHELGHHFLHMASDGQYVDGEANLFRLQPPDDREPSRSQRVEIQANLFAAALLMPEPEVRRYWIERRSIDDLARVFRVSAMAMGYRVASLGLE